MNQVYEEIFKEIGDNAEKLFEQYLNNEKIPFYRIDQEQETKSEELKNRAIRPDYLIHTKRGIFYIDVKCREKKTFGTEERFPIDQYKINGLFQFQEEFHREVWIAFTDKSDNPQFYFSNISHIYDYYIHIKEAYEKVRNELPLKQFMYIPDSLLLFERLSLEKGFYNEYDSEYLKKEVETLKRCKK